jgi:hypothetical protein
VYRVDEIDSIVDKMLQNEKNVRVPPIPGSGHFDDSIYKSSLFPTKRDWTAFLDRINEGFFPNAVFIFTTNRDLTEYDEKDPALFRNGRFNVRKQLN